MLKVSTDDDDFTNVGHQYAITDGNYPFAFYIEPSTGHILVAGILDYETKSEYNLTVSVSEQSITEVFPTDHAIVYIKILDSNDHPPVFQPKTYRRTLPEDVTIGTEVRVVTCSDMDEGSNAVPTFSIASGNIGDVFEVVSHPADGNMGIVQVAGRLDREMVSSYMLEITATDIGGLTGWKYNLFWRDTRFTYAAKRSFPMFKIETFSFMFTANSKRQVSNPILRNVVINCCAMNLKNELVTLFSESCRSYLQI